MTKSQIVQDSEVQLKKKGSRKYRKDIEKLALLQDGQSLVVYPKDKQSLKSFRASFYTCAKRCGFLVSMHQTEDDGLIVKVRKGE